MQDISPSVQSPESPASQTRADKLAILRRNGYAPDRCAALEGAAPMPPVLDDVVETTDMEMTAHEIGEIVAPEIEDVINNL